MSEREMAVRSDIELLTTGNVDLWKSASICFLQGKVIHTHIALIPATMVDVKLGQFGSTTVGQ